MLQGFVKANTWEMALPDSRKEGLSGVEIVAVGRGSSYRSVSNSDGRFEIAGLPARDMR
jgi:hypothetical protein